MNLPRAHNGILYIVEGGITCHLELSVTSCCHDGCYNVSKSSFKSLEIARGGGSLDSSGHWSSSSGGGGSGGGGLDSSNNSALVIDLLNSDEVL